MCSVVRNLLLLAAGLVAPTAGGVAAVTPAPPGIDGHVFVTPDWLAEHINDTNLVVLHVGSPDVYAKGHIPGARLIELEEFAPTRDGLAVELGEPSALCRAFGTHGVGEDSKVVLCFAEGKVALAARAWFTLDVLGHGDHAAILDGGLEAWQGDGRDTSTLRPPPRQRDLSARGVNPLVVDAAWVRGHLYTPGIRLVDSRPATSYAGNGDAAGGTGRSGHVPGARNLPWRVLFDDNERLLGQEKLNAAFAAAQVGSDDDVVTYCGVGLAASVVHAVGRQLGFRMRMYDGSFQDWSRIRNSPVARSPRR